MGDATITAELMAAAKLASPEAAARAAPYLDSAAVRFGIDTPARIAAWLAQCAQESMEFRRTVECMNYSAHRLVEIWPTRFSAATAVAYAHQGERIASYVYGGRLGNGPEATQDGWRYRGRGYIQITGRSTYAEAGRALALDLIGDPDLAATPGGAALTAAWYWHSRDLNALADRGDIDSISRKVNGGTHGLLERRAYYARALKAFTEGA